MARVDREQQNFRDPKVDEKDSRVTPVRTGVQRGFRSARGSVLASACSSSTTSHRNVGDDVIELTPIASVELLDLFAQKNQIPCFGSPPH